MGIHTGLATPREDGYVALAVYQAARVVAAGHGGQILVSSQTAAELDDVDDVNLVSLGRYRLRDFEGPERLYAVQDEGLLEDLPAIRAIPSDGHNLVAAQNPTVGREEMVSTLAEVAQSNRLTTLVGPGGVGKSRLVGDLGMHIAPAWEDGVWRVDLSAVTEADLAATAIAEAVGAPARPGEERWSDVIEHLSDRSALVILDNCEHLVSILREMIGSLFASSDAVGVVATSREPIRVPNEIAWPVPPLDVPDESTSIAAEAMESSAIRLFVERGAAARPGFELDDTNTGAVVSICKHLDGLPLSLELAAANLAFQSPAEVLTGIGDRFRLLRSRDRTFADRHHTMEGVLDWSYLMLSEVEQTAFRRLAVFATSFSLATASAALAAEDLPADAVPQLIWSLVDRSLVTPELAAQDTRYRLLETIQAYGRDRLTETHEVAATAERMVRHYLERVGPWEIADRAWIGEVEVELDNIRTLIPLLPSDHQTLAQQLAVTIGHYHDNTNSYPAGVEELTRYTESLSQPAAERASLLATLADLHLRIGDTNSAETLVDEARQLRTAHGVPAWDDVGIERSSGEIARRSGDLEAAGAIARQTLDRPISERGMSRMYNLLGTTAAAMGDMEVAYQALAEELRLNTKLGYEGYITSAHGNLAEVAMRLGETGTAAHHQRACLQLATAQGFLPMVAFSLIVAARLAGIAEVWEIATRLQTKADALLEKIGLVLYEDDRREIDRLLDDARTALGAAEYLRISREGANLDTPTAIDLADTVLAEAEQEVVTGG
jgi:predicted ATPase